MNFIKGTIRASPFVGVFACLTDKTLFVPHSVQDKEIKDIEGKLDVAVVKCSLANSTLIGVLGKAIGNRIAVPEIADAREIRDMERNGVEVLKVGGVMALGNLVALNGKAGIASPLLREKQVRELQDFFGVKIKQERVSGSDLVGAAVVVTNKGFIVHQSITETEHKSLEKLFKVRGIPTTAKYGDRFIGNDVVANSSGAIVGDMTTPFEMMRIDEALTGD